MGQSGRREQTVVLSDSGWSPPFDASFTSVNPEDDTLSLIKTKG